MPLPGPLGDTALSLAAGGLFQLGRKGPGPAPQPPITIFIPEPRPRPSDNITRYFSTIADEPFLGTAPSEQQVLQGHIANCPLPAVLAAMARSRSNTVRAMVTKIPFNLHHGNSFLYISVFSGAPNFNHYYTVKFSASSPIIVSPLVYEAPAPPQLTQGREIMYAHSPGALPSWVSLVEKAYVLMKDPEPDVQRRRYTILDGGGKGLDPIEVMNDVAGQGAEWVMDPQDPDFQPHPKHQWTRSHLRQVFAAANHVPTVAASRNDQTVIGLAPIFAHHDYAVVGMLGDGRVQLYNAQELPAHDPHHFKDPALSLTDFQRAFRMVVLKP
jgi:hypothetical protein